MEAQQREKEREKERERERERERESVKSMRTVRSAIRGSLTAGVTLTLIAVKDSTDHSGRFISPRSSLCTSLAIAKGKRQRHRDGTRHRAPRRGGRSRWPIRVRSYQAQAHEIKNLKSYKIHLEVLPPVHISADRTPLMLGAPNQVQHENCKTDYHKVVPDWT